MTPTTYPEELVEKVAEDIYSRMSYDEPRGVKPVWVPRGNSSKQDDARREACALLDLIYPLAFFQGAEASADLCEAFAAKWESSAAVRALNSAAKSIRALTKNEERP